jgi:hypothetical protein
MLMHSAGSFQYMVYTVRLQILMGASAYRSICYSIWCCYSFHTVCGHQVSAQLLRTVAARCVRAVAVVA